MKEIFGKLDFIKIKNFYSVKDTVKRMKRQVRGWEEKDKSEAGKTIFAKHTSDF